MHKSDKSDKSDRNSNAAQSNLSNKYRRKYRPLPDSFVEIAKTSIELLRGFRNLTETKVVKLFVFIVHLQRNVTLY